MDVYLVAVLSQVLQLGINFIAETVQDFVFLHRLDDVVEALNVRAFDFLPVFFARILPAQRLCDVEEARCWRAFPLLEKDSVGLQD